MVSKRRTAKGEQSTYLSGTVKCRSEIENSTASFRHENMTNFIHYSRAELGELKFSQEDSKMKPAGLVFDLDSPTTEFGYRLDPTCRLHVFDLQPGNLMPFSTHFQSQAVWGCLDWVKVADKYDGIYIQPTTVMLARQLPKTHPLHIFGQYSLRGTLIVWSDQVKLIKN